MIATLKKFLLKTDSDALNIDAESAYDIWSASYDKQPGNLMLDLDEVIFTDLMKRINIENKKVVDIGCGTGRHWQKIYAKNPSLLMGFDISEGMLRQLKCKYPKAITVQSTDNLLSNEPDASIDCLITTLTIAHIKNIDEAIASWSRVLKKGGDLVITDFHPGMLAKGGKRSFRHEGKSLWVINFVHSLEKVKTIFAKHGLTIVKQEEKCVGESVRSYYESQHAQAVYDRFKGMPIIYGLHLKKQLATK